MRIARAVNALEILSNTSSKRIALCLILGALLALPALPQASTGTVSGTVRDQTGAVVPGAPVALTATATTALVRTTTNESGFYVFPGVIPGSYRLTIEVSGMERYEATLTVQVQQSAVVDVALKVGSAATQVLVTDVTPVVTVDNPTLGQVLDRSRIEQLPVNGRQITALLQTVPGNNGVRAYGMRFMTQEMTLDGATLVNSYFGDQVVQRQPGLDTIQEISVMNNNVSAEFSRPMTIVLATKSGTNQIHGTAFWTNRNSGYGVARSRTDTWSKPPYLNRNEFGASAGGPVYIPGLYDGRNRTFWFAGYEGYRLDRPSFKGASVPTEAMRNGDFSGLIDGQGRRFVVYDPWSTDNNTWARQPLNYGGKVNSVNPSRMSPLAKYLFSITPQPTLPNVNPLLDSNWWGEWPYWSKQWTLSARADHNFTDNDRIYGVYSRRPYTLYTQQWSFPTSNEDIGGYHNEAPSWSVAVNYLRILSPTFSNTLLASVGRETWWKGTGLGRNYSDELGLPNVLNQPGWFNIGQAHLPGYTFGGDAYQGQWFTHYILEDNAMKVYGRHNFKFGVHVRYDQNNLLADQNTNYAYDPGTMATSLFDAASSRANPLAAPLTGSNLVNEYIGVMNYQNVMTQKWFYSRSHDYALYFQDNLRLTRRLTLNLGLRWEYYTPLREKYDQYNGFDVKNQAVILGSPLETMYALGNTTPSVISALQGLGVKFETHEQAGWPKGLMTTRKTDFAPRLGFAYQAGDGLRSFVLRGGYSISYFPMNTRSHTQGASWNMPGAATFSWSATDPTLAPDGIANYGMRSVPTVIAGLNSANAISLDKPAGITAGSNATVSRFVGQPQQLNGRVQNWNLTIEKEIAKRTSARVTYQGSHSDRIIQNRSLNDSTPSNVWYYSKGLPMPTGPLANVATRPYNNTTYGTLWSYYNTGYMNQGGMQFEIERSYQDGYAFQMFYTFSNVLGNVGAQSWGVWVGGDNTVPAANNYLPGAVSTDWRERDRLLNYKRDTSVPKHEVRWNWLIDLPLGKGKKWMGNAGRLLDGLIGGWQIAGMGTMNSSWWSLPTNIWPNGNSVEVYGDKYPIEDCTTGTCYPGYLYWNGYIPSNRINSRDANGRPNGYMGVPADYKPAAQPLIPWGSTALPPNAPQDTNISQFWDTNTTWVVLRNGTVQRTTTPVLHPWRQQYLIGPWNWNQDASLFKTFKVNERFRVRLNVDAFNVFNHPGNPTGMASTGVQSLRSSVNTPRQLQLSLRVSW